MPEGLLGLVRERRSPLACIMGFLVERQKSHFMQAPVRKAGRFTPSLAVALS